MTRYSPLSNRLVGLAVCILALSALSHQSVQFGGGKKRKQAQERVVDGSDYSAKDLHIYWETECGCTGLEVEASHLLCPNLETKVNDLSVNICTPDNPRCAGYKRVISGCLSRASDNQIAEGKDVDVYIAHVGFRGVCGRPHKHAPDHKYAVVRAMFEVDGIPSEAVKRCNDKSKYDEIWVPSHFVRDAFIRSGVHRNRIVHIPEAIDVSAYNPAKVQPIELQGKRGFNFLSIFKLEERKNWKLLLRAFVREFHADEDVALHIKANPYMGADPEWAFQSYLGQLDVSGDDLPMINLITEKYPMKDMPRFYASADAFVLPSRGEGWGLTLMEAMAMGLPTIGTNFGGATDFMNKFNSFLIDVDELVPGFEGFNWASASETHLRRLLRYVYDHQEDARRVGARARKDITTRFSQEAVSEMIRKRLDVIAEHLHSENNVEHHDHGAVHHKVLDTASDL